MTRPKEDTEHRLEMSVSSDGQEAPLDRVGASEPSEPVAVDVFPSVASFHHSVTVHPKGMTTLQLLRIRSGTPSKVRA